MDRAGSMTENFEYIAFMLQIEFSYDLTIKFLPLLLRQDWFNSHVLLKQHPCHDHRVGEFYPFSCFLAASNKNLKFHENKGVFAALCLEYRCPNSQGSTDGLTPL